MKTRTDLLNHLAEKYQLKYYLEIGVQNTSQNFDKINCDTKISVDPDPNARATFCLPSDFFFINLKNLFNNSSYGYGVLPYEYDLIFIDGLHSAEQVQKDFCNAMDVLSDNGWVAMHDTSPEQESLTHFPRDKQGTWNGSTYKFAAKLKSLGIEVVTVDVDHGVTLVRKTDIRPVGVCDMTWDYFNANRKELLKLVSWDEFLAL